MPLTPHPELPALDDLSARIDWLVGHIPSGRVATYGQLAFYAGRARAPRAVGNRLKRATADDGLPWWRVLNAQGASSFAGDPAQAARQRALLVAEGVSFDADGRCDLDVAQWDPEVTFWQET